MNSCNSFQISASQSSAALSSTGRSLNRVRVTNVIHHYRFRPTHLLKSRKIPQVWKIAALLRLDCIHNAIVALQKNTFACWLILQGQSASIRRQTRVLLHEVKFREAQKRRQARDLRLGQSHLPRPTAARGATITLIENRHFSRHYTALPANRRSNFSCLVGAFPF